MRHACCPVARRATPQDTISIDVSAEAAGTIGIPVALCTAAFQHGGDTRHLVLSLTHSVTRSSD